MALSLLPDVGGMGVLIAILLYLWHRHPQRRVGWWLVGLGFIFLEAVAWMFYPAAGPWHIPLHVIALDSYVLAGATFLWSAADRPSRMRRMRAYALINVGPWLALATAYGMNLTRRPMYCAIAAVGFVLGTMTSLKVPRSGWLLAAQASGWLPLALFLYQSQYRDAVYWGLAWGYAWIALVFWQTLPRATTGRLAMVGGFFVWSLCFLAHPWAARSLTYSNVVAEFWSMQKFLVTVGMLLVLLEEQIRVSRRLALHDQLTGLPNRRLFEERLTQDLARAQRRGGRLALIVLDMNGFKAINDSLGHDAGDELLRRTGQQLRKVVRSSDTLARMGGDEFTIIANDVGGADGIEALLVILRQAVSRSSIIEGREVQLSASAGVAVFPDDATDRSTLRRLADKHMYAQKQTDQSPRAWRIA